MGDEQERFSLGTHVRTQGNHIGTIVKCDTLNKFGQPFDYEVEFEVGIIIPFNHDELEVLYVDKLRQ